MEEIKWTKEQLAIIEDRGSNMLVSASAGSGKTTVMTKRIIDLIKDEHALISDFLVVTFTKTSAEDMKKKIIDKLLEAGTSDFLLEQVDAVYNSDISDLHSFYSRLVSTYFYEVQIDPNFHIVDELESELLKNRAIEKLFEKKQRENDADFFDIVSIFQKNRGDDELKQTIFKFSNFLNSHIDGESWFNETTNSSYNEDLNENICAKNINDYVTSRVKDLSEEIDNFSKLCEKSGCEKYYEYFVELGGKVKTIKKNSSFIQNAKSVFEIEFNRLPAVKEEFKNLNQAAVSLNKKVKEEVENFKENYILDDEAKLKSDIKQTKFNIQRLYNLVKEFDEAYAKLKREINGLDFNDLEKFAYKILSNSQIADAVRAKYKYIFVDEYQDINAIQEKIISIISSKNNRFMVGDIKQSIYRFRLCDPEIFLQKYKEYSLSEENGKVFKLNSNFRSDKKILKFVDRVFSGVMTEKFGEINYQKDSTFIAGENNLDEKNSAVLCYIDSTKKEETEYYRDEVYSVKNHEESDDEESQNIILEARLVADKIAKIIESEKASFSDFAILVFARNSKISKFIEELSLHKIPVSADDKYDMMSKNYITEVMNFAKLLVCEKDDFLVVSVLKSKLFNLSDGELAEIRLLNKSINFYDCLLLYKKLQNANLSAKIENFYNLLEKYRKISATISIQDLLKLIVNEFKLFELNLLDADGEKINAEIDKFISKLPNKNAYEFFIEMGDFSLIHQNECGGDAVKLMSVHGSKGIEFKYVFVINTASKINFTSSKGKILFNKNFGVGLDYFDKISRVQNSTIPISFIRMIERRKIAEEQQRVLYVALTRAIKKLFVICTKNRDQLKAKFPERPSSYINWFEPIIVSEIENNHDENLCFEKYELSDFEKTTKLKPKRLLLQSNQNKAELEEFSYSHRNAESIALKSSVSKILKLKSSNLEDFDDEFEAQEKRLSDEGLKSFAERGSAYHKVFELINFKSEENYESQVDSIINGLKAECKNLVDKNKILRVLNLPFFEEVKNADKIFKEREFFANVSTKSLGADDEDNFILQGVVDLIIIKDNEITILDYKTGRANDDKLKSYEFQLNTYADVISRAFNMPIKNKLICFIDEQKMLEI